MSKELGNIWHFCEDYDNFNYGAGATPQRNFRKASLAASIVRESLQNSIDAAIKYPVRVVYRKKELAVNDYPALFGIAKCADGNTLKNHFEGMADSINSNDEQNAKEYADKCKYVSSLKEKSTIPYLCISDSNTSGMDYVENRNKGTFASFVRSLGKNDKKSKGSAGSNGVGKGAYLQMSQFNTLLVSSRSETQTLFEGYMLMLSHYVGDQAYHPYAFYDSNNRKPVSEESEIPEDFIRHDIGTDINIIGIDDTDWGKQVNEMIIAVLKNFWLAIHTERLVVVIEGTVIDKMSLPHLLKTYFKDQKDGAQERTYNPLPYYNIVASEPSDKIIHRKETLPLLGDVEFYLNKAKTGNGRILYMRESRMLIYSKVEPLYNQINGVFVCTGEKGNEILKEAENEAHNEWKAKAGDDTARKAIKIIEDYIKNFLNDELGSVTNGTIDIKSLANRLSITTEPVYDEDYEDELDSNDDGDTVTETIETTDADIIKTHKEKKETVGKVHVRKRNYVTPDENGDLLQENVEGGEGPEIPSTYIPNPEPDPFPQPRPEPIPGPTPYDDLDTGTTTNQESLDGKKKKTISINSFDSWVFAKKVDGEYIYEARIKCAKEHEKANLIVTIGGESGDDHLDIKESSLGTPLGYTIKDVYLNKGITVLTFKFKENEKNSVKISAYEYKD